MYKGGELGSPAELERRVALVRPEDTLRGFLFGATMKAVRKQGDEAAVLRCIEAAGGAGFLAFFCYPVPSLLRMLYSAAWSLSGSPGGFEEALRCLGRRAAPDLLSSPAGRSLLTLSVSEPRRLFNNLPVLYRALMRHGQCSVVWVGPRKGILQFEGNVLPHPYFEGAVRTVFGALGKVDVEVRGRQAGPSGCDIEFSWE